METKREIGSGDQNRLFFYPETPLCGQLDLNYIQLGEFISEQEAQIKKLNEDFSKQVEDLQKLYEGYMKDKEAAEAALKGQGLGLAKAVRKSLEAKTDEL